MIEDERRAEFGVLVVLDLDDARMVDAFEDLELALRLADQRVAGIGGGRGGDGVDADAPAHGVHRGVRAFPVLIGVIRRALGEQRAELVVADPAMLVRRPDTGLGHRPGEHAGVLVVDVGQLDLAGATGAVVQRTDDAGIGLAARLPALVSP